ncbi:MAG TPA: hypothetical protein VFA33_14810 [Bryobacteraceae bacterium]|nr:hypothetical protein [Bryobacteraceae bacterium]
MHFRRLACFLLGAWLAGSLFMALVAIENFRSVDRLLDRPAPAAARQFEALGHDAARTLLRYQVSEQNRWYFQAWGAGQLFLGLGLLLVLVFGSTETLFSLVLAGLMLVVAGVQHFALTPEIVALGRVIDFVPLTAVSADRGRFWTMHSLYSGAEVLKWLIGFVLAGKLVIGTRKLSRGFRQVDTVNKSDHRHVDG